ncbi:MAG: ABC transporter ATP-binding protein [Acidobacteria bacterium]|nr:ABC transporter ATP-binding protein [Acidobacteriota bacterium]
MTGDQRSLINDGVALTGDRRPATSGSILQADRLSKQYLSGRSVLGVLNDLDLAVREGEMIAIVGASGAGKSTLLHLLGGLDRPTAGRVLFNGFDISELSAVDLARFRSQVVGFIFQFHHLLPEFTALENVMMPLLIRGTRKLEAAERARGALASVGLETRLKHRPAELSGGEQQRMALARALVTNPRLLLADEPTGNLDTRTGERMFALLQRLHETNALTSIIATHNQRLAAQCDRVLRLEDGQLFEDGV